MTPNEKELLTLIRQSADPPDALAKACEILVSFLQTEGKLNSASPAPRES